MLRNSEIIRRHRKSSRIALYGSLVLVAAAAAVLTASSRLIPAPQLSLDRSQAWADVDWAAMPEVQLFQGYLQVDTNAEDGREVDGAEFLAGHLRAAGIPTTLEALGDRHANLWAILEGESPEAVVLHHHIDVEPIFRPEAWKHSPFSGRIEPPWIYGRGAFDMKSLAVAQLHAFLELHRSGKRLRRSVIFLATGSEERGSDLGARWLVRHHPELLERFWVVLTEGGIVEAVADDEGKFWGVEIGQKRYVDVIVCSSNRQRLLEAQREAVRISRENSDRHLTPEVAEILVRYAPTRGRANLRELLAEPERLIYEMDRFEPLPDYLKALLRNEVHPFPIEEVEGGFRSVFKLHLLPGAEAEEVRRRMLPDWLLFGMTWTLIPQETARRSSPVDHPAFLETLNLLGERFPEIPAGPYFLPWTATDSRFFRQEGIPSYGFSPFFILTPDTMTGANPNERVALPGFVSGVEIYRDLLQRLATEPL